MPLFDQSVCVLLVEDGPGTAGELRQLMTQWGYDVRVTRGGAAGFALASRLGPAAIVVTAALPGRGWLNLARSLRLALGDNTPVLIAASRLNGQEVRRRAWEAGFDHFLCEPFDPERLRVLLASVPVPA